MVGDQHPDPKTTAEGPVEKSRYDLLVGDVLPVFLSLSSISNRYPSCCPWSPGPASPSRPCGLPSGFWRQGVAYLLMEIWRRSLTWVWRSTSTRRPDSKVPGSRWGCGRLGCIVRAVEDIGFFCISSQKLKAKWSHLKMVIWLCMVKWIIVFFWTKIQTERHIMIMMWVMIVSILSMMAMVMVLVICVMMMMFW